MTNEIEFQVEADEEGGYVACAKPDKMLKNAIDGCFFDKPAKRPQLVRLHVDELFALA